MHMYGVYFWLEDIFYIYDDIIILFISFPAKLFFTLVAKVRPVLPLHPLLSYEVMDCSPRHHNGDRYIEVQFFCFSLFRIM